MPERDQRPQVMGIVNATPDSFSGDGLDDAEALVARALAHARDGAEWIDLGGESTRPGATPVPEEEELRRVLGVLPRIVARAGVPVSIDTTKPTVADAALAAGARMVNDVSGLRDPGLAGVARDHGAFLVLMHNGWTLGESQGGVTSGVVDRVAGEISRLTDLALAQGVSLERLIADPGIGFGKRPEESLALVRGLEELRARIAPLPLLVGPSRKGFIGRALGLSAPARLDGTLAVVAIAAAAGAEIIRVHDVAQCVRAALMGWAVRTGALADASG